MNLNKALLLLATTLASKSRVAEGQDTGHFVDLPKNFVDCFAEIREEGGFHWPVAEKSLCDVSSVFGPAISSCTDSYRFNRALSIHGAIGDDVKAPYGGVVVKAEMVEGDVAWVVVIEHTLPKRCEFHGHGVRKFYTTHDKLQSVSVEVGDTLEAGEVFAEIGPCLRHCGSSLLMGLRIGASCSLAYANQVKASTGTFPDCNNKGFDPHANPHLLSPFVDDETHFNLVESECWGPDEEGVIEVDSLKIETGCAGADINRYEVYCGDKTHFIDYNMRESFDATESGSIHLPPDNDKPYIKAYPYKHNSAVWTQEVVIPDEWYHAAGGADCCNVKVFDTWGNMEEQKVCGTSRSYTSMFAQMRDEVGFVWPTPASARDQLYSTFGIRSAGSGDEFHNGIDIRGNIGEPVLAVFGGKVVTKTVYSKGGNSIMVEHEFTDKTATKLNTACGAGDRIAADRFYTMYQHLDTFMVEKGDIIEAGTQIGTMGMTGDEKIIGPQLHFELRFGTRCTLKYCSNPANQGYECCQYMYEPTIHPMLVLPPEPFDVEFTELIKVSTSQDGEILLKADSHRGSANVIEFIHAAKNGPFFSCEDPGTYIENNSHLLDYSVKHGFHTWRNDQLDGLPQIKGVSVGTIPLDDQAARDMDWIVELHIPNTWIGTIVADDHLIVRVTDVWGVTFCEAWQLYP